MISGVGRLHGLLDGDMLPSRDEMAHTIAHALERLTLHDAMVLQTSRSVDCLAEQVRELRDIVDEWA